MSSSIEFITWQTDVTHLYRSIRAQRIAKSRVSSLINHTLTILFLCNLWIFLPDEFLPPFSLIRDLRKQNTRGNVSKISVNLTRYRHVGSKSTNHSPLTWRREGQKVTLVAVIGGFRSDMSITRKIDRNFLNVSASVLFSKVSYQGIWW